eukprot:6340469-Prymnesium_polylepis.1
MWHCVLGGAEGGEGVVSMWLPARVSDFMRSLRLQGGDCGFSKRRQLECPSTGAASAEPSTTASEPASSVAELQRKLAASEREASRLRSQLNAQQPTVGHVVSLAELPGPLCSCSPESEATEHTQYSAWSQPAVDGHDADDGDNKRDEEAVSVVEVAVALDG